MRIRTRKVTTSKSMEAAMQALKSAAYYWPKGKFEQDSFSFYCARRQGVRSMVLIPVQGSMFVENGKVTVVLEIHADLAFYIGCMISLATMIEILRRIIMGLPNWYMGCLAILFGGVVSCSSVLTASEILDRLEAKLCRLE